MLVVVARVLVHSFTHSPTHSPIVFKIHQCMYAMYVYNVCVYATRVRGEGTFKNLTIVGISLDKTVCM